MLMMMLMLMLVLVLVLVLVLKLFLCTHAATSLTRRQKNRETPMPAGHERFIQRFITKGATHISAFSNTTELH